MQPYSNNIDVDLRIADSDDNDIVTLKLRISYQVVFGDPPSQNYFDPGSPDEVRFIDVRPENFWARQINDAAKLALAQRYLDAHQASLINDAKDAVKVARAELARENRT
jgi:hypothetical protein